MKTTTLITLHLPAEPHTDTSMEADKSDEWSTAERGRQRERWRERPPSDFQFLIYLQLFKLSRLHLSDPLILSHCPTNMRLILSSFLFVFAPLPLPLLPAPDPHLTPPQGGRLSTIQTQQEEKKKRVCVILLMCVESSAKC